MSVGQSTQFVQHDLFGLSWMHTAVNVEAALVGNSVKRGGTGADVSHRDGTRTKKWIGTALEFLVQALNTLDKGNGFIKGIVAAFGRAGMTTAPLKGDADLGTPTMATINIHPGRFADDDEIRTNAFVLNQGIAGDAITPFFHIAKIIERPVPRQPQLFQRCHGINHWRGRALFVARA